MKTKTIITELTQEDLVDLLCTATYGSSWLNIYANDREGIVVEEKDCREDIWAKCLLAGKKITCVDYYAEGEHYGPIEDYTFGKEDEECEYQVGLQDIINGLQKCADGLAGSWCRTCFGHFAEGEGNLDLTEAEMLVQIILFDELIYG